MQVESLVSQELNEQQRKGSWFVFMSTACAVRVEPHSLEPTGDLLVELNRGTLICPALLSSPR